MSDGLENMPSGGGPPIVVGSSMTGLLVSHGLSRRGIDHVMVGADAPPAVPRLGESMNECAGPEMWRWFGHEFRQFFFVKNHISLLDGPFATQLHLGDANACLDRMAERMLRNGHVRFPWRGNVLVHVDRVGFDRALYDKCRTDPRCRFVTGRIEKLDYDAKGDRLRGVRLEDGTQWRDPQYVFDATGPRGLVAEAAGVGRESISNEQTVVWTHYRRDDARELPRHWWLFGTNLLRLHREPDSVDGIAWLIPMGRVVSIGVSVAAPTRLNAEEIVELMQAAYVRRGIDFVSLFPHRLPPQQLTHRYFIRERAYGGNWLLVGGTYLQVWFPSSAGMWTITAAAGLAPRLIEQPREVGALYESMMRPLLDFHRMLDDWIAGPGFAAPAAAYVFWARWIAQIPARFSNYLRIANDHPSARGPMNWLLETASRLFRASPRWCLLYWGLPLIHVHQVPKLDEQADSFPGYFHTRRFRTRGFLRGFRRAVFGRLPQREG